MYGLPDRLRPLSAAEEQVMLAVWACREPATRRDIDEKLRGKGWAPATVLNFLYRLEEKGWVKSGKQGNHNIYAATVTQRALRCVEHAPAAGHPLWRGPCRCCAGAGQ